MFRAREDAKAAGRPFSHRLHDAEGGCGAGRRQLGAAHSGQRPDLAYRFIDFMLDGSNAADVSNLIGAGNPNAAALPDIRAEIAADPAIFPTPGGTETPRNAARFRPEDAADPVPHVDRDQGPVKWRLDLSQASGGAFRYTVRLIADPPHAHARFPDRTRLPRRRPAGPQGCRRQRRQLRLCRLQGRHQRAQLHRPQLRRRRPEGRHPLRPRPRRQGADRAQHLSRRPTTGRAGPRPSIAPPTTASMPSSSPTSA